MSTTFGRGTRDIPTAKGTLASSGAARQARLLSKRLSELPFPVKD